MTILRLKSILRKVTAHACRTARAALTYSSILVSMSGIFPLPAGALAMLARVETERVHQVHLIHLAHLAHEHRNAILAAETRDRPTPIVVALPTPTLVADSMSYSFSQLESLWTGAGGSTTLAPVMAAIAMAESGGNAAAVNDSTDATGLWQINLDAGNGAYVPGGAANATNPQDNAAAAVAIEKDQGLGAWTTYTSGEYQQYMPGGSAYTGSASGTGSSSTTPANTTSFWSSVGEGVLGGVTFGIDPTSSAFGEALSSLGSLGVIASDFHGVFTDIGQMMKWLSWMFAPSSWLRIGAFIVGVGLLIGSGFMFKDAI